MTDKTEEATPRRLRKAREEGDSGVSPFAAQAISFLVAVTCAPAALRALAARTESDLQGIFARAGELRDSPAFDAPSLAIAVVTFALPVLVAAALAGAIVQVVQTGGAVATKRIGPRLDRLDPIAGFRGLFSATRLFAVVRSLVGAGLVCGLAWYGIGDHVIHFARLVGRPAWIEAVVREVAGGLAWRVALLGLALGAIDLLVVRRAWLRRLRMSKSEVKREHRESEGDPQIKAARERAYRELVTQASIAQVSKATVVVVNPAHLACALRYDQRQGDDAPVVVATGEGELAAWIVREAHRCGVPVLRDVGLARALVALEEGQAIPEQLYDAVAEILREVLAGTEPLSSSGP